MVNTRSHDPYSGHSKPKTRRRAAPKKTKATPPPAPPAEQGNDNGGQEPVNGADNPQLDAALEALKAESGKE